tara:strand:+ start:24459 stop:24869 length:411 start_codon:yes stop_codon:yes gene_type:complete
MTWVALSSLGKKCWAWCKRNWKLFLGIAIPVMIWLVARRDFNYSEITDRIKKDYEKEIGIIEEAHRMEIQKKEEAERKYQEAIAAIEKKYDDLEKQLSEKKKQEVKKIIEKNLDNPDEITNKLSELTGFDIYTGEG